MTFTCFISSLRN